jgi:hypothetical protein
MSADLGYVFAFIEQFVALGELSDHLLRGVFPSLHGAVLLAPFWSIGTLINRGSFQGDLRNVSRKTSKHKCVRQTPETS